MSKFHLRKRNQEGGDQNAWLITYADFITLVLAFFVVIIAAFEPQLSKFDQLKKSLMSGFLVDVPENKLKQVYGEFQSLIAFNNLERNAVILRHSNGVDFEIGSLALYDKNSAELKEEGKETLNNIAKILMKYEAEDHVIEVEGHTDNSRVDTTLFNDNWELSSQRAINIVKYLVAQGIKPSVLKASGLGEYHPKAPNHDASGRPIPLNQALNRRIVIRYLRQF